MLSIYTGYCFQTRANNDYFYWEKKARKMKLFWTGTDSLMLVDCSMRKLRKRPYWYAFRVLIKIMDYFIEGHYCDTENIADNLRKFGTKKPVRILIDKVCYPEKFKKTQHSDFNVIYYNPKSCTDISFTRWLYGLDIIELVKPRLPHIKFIELDGSASMDEVYPYVDFMIRPNRHDGASRMRQECEINEIPYYWTTSNPNVEDCINAIKKEYAKTKYPTSIDAAKVCIN